MADLANWALHEERGEDWLLARPTPPEAAWGTSPQLAEGIWSLRERQPADNVILDMQSVDFLSSFLIGQLVMLQKRAAQAGVKLWVCSLSEACHQALTICRLDSQLAILPGRDEVFAAMAG